MHVPTEDSKVVPILTSAGFEFQYAKKGLLVLTKVRLLMFHTEFDKMIPSCLHIKVVT